MDAAGMFDGVTIGSAIQGLFLLGFVLWVYLTLLVVSWTALKWLIRRMARGTEAALERRFGKGPL